MSNSHARHFILAAVALILLCATSFTAVQGRKWIQSKQNLLEPTHQPLKTELPATEGQGHILLFGDSRVSRWTPLPPGVVKAGYAGESAIRLQNEVPRLIRQLKPSHIIVLAGVNDAVAISLRPRAEQEKWLEKTLEAYAHMAQAARQQDIPITFMAPPLSSEKDRLRQLLWRGRVNPLLEKLNARLPAVALRYQAHFIRPPALDPVEDYTDALHFSPSGYQRLNQWLSAALPVSDPSFR